MKPVRPVERVLLETLEELRHEIPADHLGPYFHNYYRVRADYERDFTSPATERHSELKCRHCGTLVEHQATYCNRCGGLLTMPRERTLIGTPRPPLLTSMLSVVGLQSVRRLWYTLLFGRKMTRVDDIIESVPNINNLQLLAAEIPTPMATTANQEHPKKS